MRVDRRVSPNQTALWTVFELRGCTRRRAINGPLTPVDQGQQRTTSSHQNRRSGVLDGRISRSSKLVMPVRSRSPAPAAFWLRSSGDVRVAEAGHRGS
jgi:hypothetical protein